MNDKLREALEALDTEAPAVQRMAACRAILRKALAASKQEPQAQAEPEVPARLLYWHGPRHYAVPHGGIAARTYAEFPKQEADKPDSYWKNGPELITLQSHREAMAEVVRRFDELKRHGVSHHVHNEAIAKKDAALDACALPESYTGGTCLSYPGRRAEVTLHFSSIEDADRWFAAITSKKDTP